VVLVPDACATFHPELQEELWRMESGPIRVARVDDIVDRLAAS
jgi:hypothetical protein